MTDPAEGAALFLRILEDPADDAPRLIYSDWLEEHGQQGRAAFIRQNLSLVPFDELPPVGPGVGSPSVAGAYARHESLNVCYIQSADLPQCDGFRLASPGSIAARNPTPPGDGPLAVVTRGFVSEIRLPYVEFVKRAAALFAAHPITRVALTDRHSLLGSSHFWSASDDAAHMERHPQLPPLEIMVLREVFFRNESEAADWLSDRCMHYGRTAAGLPPIAVYPNGYTLVGIMSGSPYAI
jgi:uncharacterized protein (TIGR02996 family)